ncbi:MAG: DUF177 domain-containing protein [Alphaproteobacteria bacterium]
MSVMTPEFSRLISVADLGAKGKTLLLAPTKEEMRALVHRFDLENLSRFEAKVMVHPITGNARRKDWIIATGELKAEYTQRCVVTLSPVPQNLALDLELIFAPASAIENDQIGAEIVIDPETDTPDPIEDGKIDLGEAIVQQFAMALDPYPRALGAEIATQYQPDIIDKSQDFDQTQQKSTPFANLVELKSKAKNQG